MAEPNSNTQTSGSPATPAAQAAPAIDMAQLVERVYRLMREDIRLEQARGARAPRRKTR